MARRFATQADWGESIRTNRLAEKNYFQERASDSHESPQTCDSRFLAPKCDSQKGVQFGNPENSILEDQAIRANLRLDSRKSGHLSRRMIGKSSTFCSLCARHLRSVRAKTVFRSAGPYP